MDVQRELDAVKRTLDGNRQQRLTSAQQQVKLQQAIALSGDESAAQCPQCASTSFAKWGKGKTGRQRLKCRNCGKIWTS